MDGARPAVVKRLYTAALAGAPGLALLVLYALRLQALRNNPSGAGTPTETVFALMVAAFALASFLFARAAFSGKLPRLVRLFGVIAFAGWAGGLCLSMLLMS